MTVKAQHALHPGSLSLSLSLSLFLTSCVASSLPQSSLFQCSSCVSASLCIPRYQRVSGGQSNQQDHSQPSIAPVATLLCTHGESPHVRRGRTNSGRRRRFHHPQQHCTLGQPTLWGRYAQESPSTAGSSSLFCFKKNHTHLCLCAVQSCTSRPVAIEELHELACVPQPQHIAELIRQLNRLNVPQGYACTLFLLRSRPC